VAERDLQDLWLTIADQSPRGATKMLGDIDRRIARRAAHPRIGPRRRDISANVRMLVEDHILILRETLPNADVGENDFVDLIRVVDGRRDLQRLL
jgi:toxin ParE1/3/4